MSSLDSFNPSLTRYRRSDPAPVLPLRDEPDLLTWLDHRLPIERKAEA